MYRETKLEQPPKVRTNPTFSSTVFNTNKSYTTPAVSFFDLKKKREVMDNLSLSKVNRVKVRLPIKDNFPNQVTSSMLQKEKFQCPQPKSESLTKFFLGF